MTVFSAAECPHARRRAAPACIIALLALAACVRAHAEVRCVASASGFVDAIDDAIDGAEGSTWDIRVRPGIYQLNASVLFIPAGDHDNKLLYVSGGWNSGCSEQTGKASGTVIRGIASTQDSVGTQFFFLGNNNRYDFQNIRFENFYDFTVGDPACQPYNICPGTAAIVVDHVEFNNGERVNILTYDSPYVAFRNNLVTNMTQFHGDGPGPTFAPVGIEAYSNAYVDVSFNTLARLTCLSAVGGLIIRSANPNTKLHHNIVQTSGCSKDVFIETDYGGQKLTPWSNLLLSISNYNGNLADQGNVLTFDPGFVDAFNGNFRLKNDSSAVNAGMTLIDAVLMGFYGPGLDLDGQLRPTGLHYDIGAYESAVNDGAPAVITVTNTSDDADDVHSLRHAINTANAQVGTTQEIRFDIPGGCPQVILLDDELPDVTDSLYINGYSQPGSAPNDLDVGSDATVCILIAPAVGGVTHALQVATAEPAATHLTVSGIGFGSSLAAFTATAIALRGGSGHRIEGNVFGGLLPNDGNSTLGSLQRGVLIRSTATGVTVGGDENSARNYFADMLNNALVITDATTSGHVIKNNYFGLTPNGLNARSNAADAISATGGTDVSIIGNVIDASVRGIYISGASTTGFVVQGNKLGVNTLGIGIAVHANDVGIEIGGGSGQHVIGFDATANIPAGTFSNDIRNNNTAGVLLNGSAGNYISVRGNRLEANGRSGSGLGIDIGALGTLANDVGDADGGPNTQQNHPVVKSSTANGATRQIKAQLATNANQAIRIDFYRSPSCPKGATGANATTYVGSVDVNSGASGVLANVIAQVAAFGAPGYVTATATTSVGNTSELAACFAEDTIFADGVEAVGF